MEYNNRIKRIDTGDGFCEFVNDAMPIGKILIIFNQYNQGGKGQKIRLDCYMDIQKAALLSNLLLSGRMDSRIKVAEATKKYAGKDVNAYTSYFTYNGGKKFISNSNGNRFYNKPKATKEKEKYNWLDLENEKHIAIQFKIQKPMKQQFKYILRCEYYNGHIDENGLIVAEGKYQDAYQVPLNEEDAISLALELQFHINAYWNQYYTKFCDVLFKEQKCNIFSSNSNMSSTASTPSVNTDASTNEFNDNDNQPLTETFDSSSTKNNITNSNKAYGKPISELKAFGEGNYCLKVMLKDNNEKTLIFLPDRIKQVDPTKWKQFIDYVPKAVKPFAFQFVEKNNNFYFTNFS